MTLPEDTNYELTLTAPGYYPATMTLSFESVYSWKGQRGAFLDVPMLRRIRGAEHAPEQRPACLSQRQWREGLRCVRNSSG